jgi:hypothetical protein
MRDSTPVARVLAAVFVVIFLVVQACSKSKSNTSKPANSRNSNKTASSTSPQCDPNYSGCVPIASDVDCAGGPGNGPAYTKGPVRVIGKDIYELDRDGDGVGCE